MTKQRLSKTNKQMIAKYKRKQMTEQNKRAKQKTKLNK